MRFLFLSFLQGFLLSVGAEEKTCLSLGHESFSLSELQESSLPYHGQPQISANNRYMLWKQINERTSKSSSEFETSLILWDLNTFKKTEFLKFSSSDRYEAYYSFSNPLHYGFSTDGKSAYVFRPGGHLKVRTLATGKEVSRPVTDSFTWVQGLLPDGLTLWGMEGGSEILPLLTSGGKNSKPDREFDFQEQADLIKHLWDEDIFLLTMNLKTLHQTRTPLRIPAMGRLCAGVNASLSHFLFVDEDGSLYQAPFLKDGEPERIFGPIEGFHFFEEVDENEDSPGFFSRIFKLPAENILKQLERVLKKSHQKCSIHPEGRMALIQNPESDSYLLRLPEEGKEFVIPASEIFKEMEIPFTEMDFESPHSSINYQISPKEIFVPKSGNQAHRDTNKDHLKGKGRDFFFTNEAFSHWNTNEDHLRGNFPTFHASLPEPVFPYRSANTDRLRGNGKFIEGHHLPAKPRFREKQDDYGEIKEQRGIPLAWVWDAIHYPFIIHNEHHTSWSIYHIPSGHTQRIQAETLRISRNAQFSFETRWRDGTGTFLHLQAVWNPFDSTQRSVAFDWDMNELCHVSFNEAKELGFVNTIYGDFFIFNTKTKTSTRHFIGECRPYLKSLSDNAFSFFSETGPSELKVFKDRCFKNPITREIGAERFKENLFKLSEAEEPVQSVFFPFLIAALKESPEVVETYPALTGKILLNILKTSPHLYLHLYRRYPFLKDTVLPNKEAERFPLVPVRVLLEITTAQLRHSRLSDWRFLQPLKPLLRRLPKWEKEAYIGQITNSLTLAAARKIPLIRDVFQSKLFFAAKGHVEELFGSSRQPVSDITIARTRIPFHETDLPGKDGNYPSRVYYQGGGHAIPILRQDASHTERHEEADNIFVSVILASDPIEGHPGIATDFGFHYAVVKEASGRAFADANPGVVLLDDLVRWSLSGGQQQYRAQLKIETKEGIQHHSSSGPDYSGVWRDHQMTGVMVIGSSLSGFSQTLLEEYFDYFSERGFVFSLSETDDLKKLLLDAIANCRIDWFLKESHSDADERNIFRIDKVNRIIQGTLQRPDGRTEKIHLIFPKFFKESNSIFAESNKRKTELVSHAEFGEAIRLREARGCGQITYFNTGCGTYVQSRYEIETVNSPLFLNIPSFSDSNTFLNKKGTAIYALMESYRQELDFKGFREALDFEGDDPILYIFPDEAIYRESILDLIAAPLDIQIQLEIKTGNKWKPLAPDEAL